MMKVLRDYEDISGQLLKKAKSYFYLHDKTPLIVTIRLRRLKGIKQGNFPFIYLECLNFFIGERTRITLKIFWENSKEDIIMAEQMYVLWGKYILIYNEPSIPKKVIE